MIFSGSSNICLRLTSRLLMSSPSLSPSDDTPDHLREAKRPRNEWQGFEPLNGRRTDLFTDLGSRVLPPHTTQLPTACRTAPMDTQRLLSVLKVIHTQLESLTERVRGLEDVCKEMKEQVSMAIEFDLLVDSDDSDEDESDSDAESQTSNRSAPASFQY